MVSLATEVLPTASNRSIAWPARAPVAGMVVAGVGSGVGSEMIRPESGRGTMVPGFGLAGVWGTGWVCATAEPLSRSTMARNRVIGNDALRFDERAAGKVTRSKHRSRATHSSRGGGRAAYAF